MTRLLLIRVPYFREVILESFECPHCYFKNNSIKSAGQIQDQGAKFKLKVENEQDMSRYVSSTCHIQHSVFDAGR